jgi:tetratricopeptide (TPR) repeat protein
VRPAASLLLLILLLGTVHAQPAGDDESALLVGEARDALRAGNYKRAGDLLDRALALDPRQVHVYVLRASVHGALGQYDQGIAVMRKARGLAPDNVDVLTALGSQLVLARKHDEGVPILEGVVARDGKRYEAFILLAHFYAEQHRWPDAVRAFDGYLAARPGSLAAQDSPHRIARADAVLRAGDPGRARADFRALLKREPENLAARMGLAWATAAIDCTEALRLLDGLRPLESTHPQIALLDGRCAVASGLRPRALR